MHRIDSSGAVEGKFQDGNPAIGQLATQLTAVWFNDLQENLMALLADADVPPTKGRTLDLLDAVKAIAIAVAGGGNGGEAGSVPVTRQLKSSGLVTIDKQDLSQDPTIGVPAATAAEVIAGVVEGKAITPKALFDAMNGAMGDGSVQVGSIILKWGAMLGNYGEGAVYTPFPAAFPAECFFAGPVPRNDIGSNTRDFSAQLVGGPSKDGFTTYLQRGGGTTSNAISGFQWFAIGR